MKNKTHLFLTPGNIFTSRLKVVFNTDLFMVQIKELGHKCLLTFFTTTKKHTIATKLKANLSISLSTTFCANFTYIQVAILIINR